MKTKFFPAIEDGVKGERTGVTEPRVIWYVHPYAGGPGVGRYSRTYFLAHHWKKAGVRATVFLPSFHHLLDTPQNSGCRMVGDVPYEFVPSPHYSGNGFGRVRNMFEFTWRLYRQASDYVKIHGRPDVIISSSPHPYAFLATHALARKFGAISVFEVRDLWPLSLVELAGASPYHPFVCFTGWLERYAYRNADRVVSLLPLTLDHMIKKGLKAQHWVYIPNGIDRDEVTQIDDRHAIVLQARKWREDGWTVMVYTGALGRPNHMDSLIHAIDYLKKSGNTSLKVIIVGRGEKESELREKVSRFGLDQDIVFHGQISKRFILGLLNVASAGYISMPPESLYRFGVSPNKMFDYMLAGLPVVFAVSAGNDPVAEAGCGITVPPDNPIAIARGLRVLTSMTESERVEMGNRGREYALNKHTYERLAKMFLEFMYEHVQ